MVSIKRQISHYNHYGNNDIKYLVFHYVGANSTAKNNADYFCSANRDASAHYFVDDNEIWQVVEDFNGAWHVGNSKTMVNNRNSLGVEMCLVNGVVTEKTEANAVELGKHLMKKYNIPIDNVRTHYEVSGKTKVCPNWSENNWARWINFKNKLSLTNANNVEDKNEEDYNMELFSENWYLERNKNDVAPAVKKGVFKTGYHHYIQCGKGEGRRPLPPIPKEFNEGDYLELNNDVKQAVNKGTFTSGIHHYLMHGFREKRLICKNDSIEAIKKRCEELEIKLQEVKKIVE